jgi:hypothetical protein
MRTANLFMRRKILLAVLMTLPFSCATSDLFADEPAAPHIIESTAQPATLIELFSSEGCSSCPPAEAWISRLRDDPRLWKQIVPVVFHVDYWDGLGWPDRFARKAFTQRQYDYSSRFGSRSVYTPEFIVQGSEWRGGLSGTELPLNSTPAGKLRITARGPTSGVQATYVPSPGGKSEGLTIHVARLGLGIVSDVQRGENGGRQLRHDFIVLDFQSKPLGTSPVDIPAPKLTTTDQPAALAAWVTDATGAIVQVAGGPLSQ